MTTVHGLAPEETAARPGRLDSGGPIYAALRLRARVSAQRRAALRRRALRMSSRISVLLATDLLALVAARLVLTWITSPAMPLIGGGLAAYAAGPLAAPGRPASLIFWLNLLPALAIASCYSRHRGLNTSLRLVGGASLAGLAAALALAAVTGWRSASLQVLLVLAVTVPALLVSRSLSEWFMGHVWPGNRWAAPALVIGSETPDTLRIESAVAAPGGDYRIVDPRLSVGDCVPHGPDGCAAHISAAVEREGAEAVVLTEALPDDYVRPVLESAIRLGCLVLCQPRAFQSTELRPRIVWHYDQPLLEFSAPMLQVVAVVSKRVADLVGASLLLVLLSPVMLVIAIVLKLDSPGPILFKQKRAGLAGRTFRMLKFRTMRMGADAEKMDFVHLNHTGDVRLFKIPGDPRVTRFGKILRRWSLDELPQFWNVLRGEMSLVGPRPFFESDFEAYEDHHFRRLDTKPGITGLWQVSGRSELVDFEDVVFLDRQYIEQWSLWLDISILFRTISAVFRGSGAY